MNIGVEEPREKLFQVIRVGAATHSGQNLPSALRVHQGTFAFLPGESPLVVSAMFDGRAPYHFEMHRHDPIQFRTAQLITLPHSIAIALRNPLFWVINSTLIFGFNSKI